MLKSLFRFYIPAQEDQVFQSMRQPIVGESLGGKTEVAVNCEKNGVLSSVKYTKNFQSHSPTGDSASPSTILSPVLFDWYLETCMEPSTVTLEINSQLAHSSPQPGKFTGEA